MQNPIVEQLKSLKDERAGGSPDAAWLVSTKETLMMQIQSTNLLPKHSFVSLGADLNVKNPYS